MFFGKLFFPPGNEVAAYLSSLALFGVGFSVRPFGALVFGRLGDRAGRKYTFLITIVVMGLSTALIGVLPTYAQIGMWAPVILVLLRLAQGLALGGEYGGAATYVAEHAPANKRGAYTSWIQLTATLGFFLSLAMILGVRRVLAPASFASWGWRVPFLASLVLLAVSVYIRLKLQESPVYAEMKARGGASKAPLTESFARWGNARLVLAALFGATAGQGVVWYAGQFYALYFLTSTLKVDYVTAYLVIAAALLIGMPFFVVFGRLSDRLGRKGIMLAGFFLTVVTYQPIFHGLTRSANPALADAMARAPVVLRTADYHGRATLVGKALADAARKIVHPSKAVTETDQARNFLNGRGIPFSLAAAEGGPALTLTVAGATVSGFDQKAYEAALAPAPAIRPPANPAAINYPATVGAARDPGPLRDAGLRSDRGLSRRTVSDPHPLHLDVPALPYRQWLVRRLPALDRGVDHRLHRRYLRRPVVSDPDRRDVAGRRLPRAARNQGPEPSGLNRRVFTLQVYTYHGNASGHYRG